MLGTALLMLMVFLSVTPGWWAPEEWSRPVDWRASMGWQDRLREGGEVVGAIRNRR
jgi:hypothetical protein